MALTTGTRLGPYEIVSALGAGGMGEVYKARDTRLDRTVAIKVLPSEVAGDAQFRERFDREARIISQLTHPHICTLYDVGEHAGTSFLVMEFLEGETLADRIARAESKGPGLPRGEALSIAIQIADALAAAHRAGIVHRDLKPANVVLTKSGAKLLDFGLAKTAVPAVTAGSVSMLPTASPQTLTARGMILGTFQYMAPEQIEGAEADARTDIFAFGCVLHEMLTGHKAFEGKTHASLIAAILEREPPPVTTLQPLAPALVDAIVRRCLAKRADDRWQSAADLASALRWATDAASGVAATANAAAATPTARSRRLVGILALLAAVAVFAAGTFAWRYASSPTPPATSIRFEILPPPDVLLSPAPVASAAQLALSPDGRHLAFVAASNQRVSQIWVRPLNGLQARPLAGTEGASFPFWSPDGRFLGFFAGRKLKKVDIMGGAPEVLCDVTAGRGGTWNPDGTIVFSGAARSPLSQVADRAGGVVRPATTLNREQNATGHVWPQFLPDGRRYLFYQISPTEHQGIYVGSLDSAEVTHVVASKGAFLYASGYLLFVRDGILFAQAFDDRTLQTRGEAVQIADRVGYFSATLGYIGVTVSRAGALAYGPSVATTTRLQWRNRDGADAGSAIRPAVYRSPRLSPDEKRVVVTKWEPEAGQTDIQVIELDLGNEQRQTFDLLNDWFPAWSPDGSAIFFGSSRTNAFTRIFRKTGSGPDEVFAGGENDFAQYPNDTSSDGKFLSYTQSSPSGYDLGIAPLSGDAKRIPFLDSAANELQARFAPNGRWLAYASDESGKFEVYVRPFPVGSDQRLISVAGGMQPEWRRDGKELFYISADRKLMAVPVTTEGSTFSNGPPRALFDVQMPEQIPPYPTDYAVTMDGQRFLVNTVVDQPTRPALTVIVNWTAELKK